MRIIARIYTDFDEKFGIPRQSGMVEDAVGMIVFEPEYRNPDAVRGLEQFSHLWIIWQFSGFVRDGWHATVRPPRLGGNKSVGVFATRSPLRPNPVGLSSVKLKSVEISAENGPCIIVSGVDMLNGTPIYDIKPYLAYTDSHPDAADGFAGDGLDHVLDVVDEANLLSEVDEGKRMVITHLLSLDPRPSYIADPAREYGMSYGGVNVRFTVEDNTLFIKKFDVAE